LGNYSGDTISGSDGSWKIQLPAMKAGGPYKFEVKTSDKEKIKLDKVYVGEVWLASGQSNMDWPISKLNSAKKVLQDSIHSNVFVMSMDPKVLGSHVFSEEEMSKLNANDYFDYSKWTRSDVNIIGKFSGIGYSSAHHLASNLQIPIGIICNAVGGSTTQSWISRESMETTHETVDLLNDRWFHPKVMNWVSKRKSENFKGYKYYNERHPYDPTLLFDAGILPLKDFNFKGVIWYQGESNANDDSLHTKLFKMLVLDWRKHFNKKHMPFYYVQLSSIEREGWGSFRNSQRNALDALENLGMVVSSDIGNRTDVHPRIKWPVGYRLAKIALAKLYSYDNTYSGPLLDFVNVVNNTLEVHFKYGNGLKTQDGDVVKDIEIAASNKIFVKAQAKIVNNKLVVWSHKVKEPRYVRYGYSSFTEGNLVNSSLLPASTFSNY